LMRSYTLPDGRTIKVDAERFMAPEALFNPELVDVEGGGIHECVFKAGPYTRSLYPLRNHLRSFPGEVRQWWWAHFELENSSK